MNHTFLRPDIEACEASLSLAKDFLLLAGMSKETLAHVRARREGKVIEEAVREVLCRRAFSLATLGEELNTLAKTDLPMKAWTSFVTGDAAKVDQELTHAVEQLYAQLVERRKEFGYDDDVSSSSDYSDSHSVSTDGEEED